MFSSRSLLLYSTNSAQKSGLFITFPSLHASPSPRVPLPRVLASHVSSSTSPSSTSPSSSPHVSVSLLVTAVPAGHNYTGGTLSMHSIMVNFTGVTPILKDIKSPFVFTTYLIGEQRFSISIRTRKLCTVQLHQ